jgi:hypothetical protein
MLVYYTLDARQTQDLGYAEATRIHLQPMVEIRLLCVVNEITI